MKTHSLQAIFRKIQYGEGFLLCNTPPISRVCMASNPNFRCPYSKDEYYLDGTSVCFILITCLFLFICVLIGCFTLRSLLQKCIFFASGKFLKKKKNQMNMTWERLPQQGSYYYIYRCFRSCLIKYVNQQRLNCCYCYLPKNAQMLAVLLLNEHKLNCKLYVEKVKDLYVCCY